MREPRARAPGRRPRSAAAARTLLLVLAVLVVLVAPGAALADGGVFAEPPQVVSARDVGVRPVRTPDQRALVAFDGETETLVIETTVQGEGTIFAWVLPLPAVPEIEASTTGLFPTLDAMTGPGVWVDATPWWLAILWVGWFLRIAVRPGRGRLAPGVEVAALAVAGALAWFAIEMPGDSPTYGGAGDLTFGKSVVDAGAAAPEPLRVEVVSRETVGVFDTVVVRGETATDLRRWLETNGFHADATVDPVLAQYAAEGWVFVASKVRADAPSDAVRRIHPLAFRFPAKAPVYPMRLTGATNDSLVLDLWVFGEDRPSCAGMERTFCTVFRAWTGPPVDEWTSHEEIRRRAGEARGVTRLTGTFDRAAMSRDLSFTWSPLDEDRQLFYAPFAAATFATDGAAAVVAIGMVLGAALLPRSRRRPRQEAAPAADPGRRAVGAARPRRLALATAALAALAAGVVWTALPRVSVRPDALAEFDAQDAALDHLVDTAPCFARASDARAWLGPRLAALTNPWTGRPVREEDSPGNYVLEEHDGAVWFREHDAEGPVGRGRDLSTFGTTQQSWWSAHGAVRRAAGPTRTLRGSVVDGRGAPVAGAAVWFARAGTAPVRSHARLWLRTETGADGAFEIAIPAGLRADAEVHANGHPILARPAIDPESPAASPLVFVLGDLVSVRGRVVDRTGAAVAGAEVELFGGIARRDEDAWDVRTADDGTFALDGFARGSPPVKVVVHLHRTGTKCPRAEFELVPGAAPADLAVTLAPEDDAGR